LKRKEENPNAKITDIVPSPSENKEVVIVTEKTAIDQESHIGRNELVNARRIHFHEEIKIDQGGTDKTTRMVNLTPVEVLVTKNADESKDISLHAED
jgi:hypothetical protein